MKRAACSEKKIQETDPFAEIHDDHDAYTFMFDRCELRLYDLPAYNFADDLKKAFRIQDNPKADKLYTIAWSMAWSMGHSSGFHEVMLMYIEMLDLIR